jgi:hypothetical protein
MTKIAPVTGATRRPLTKHGKLKGTDADRIAAAWHFADDQGMPLNVFISINWGVAPSPVHPVQRMKRIRDALKSWLRRWHARHLGPAAPAVPFAWIEVRENPPSKNERAGANDHEGVHLALFVPDRPDCRIPIEPGANSKFKKALTGALRRWVARDCDLETVGRNVVHVRAIDDDEKALSYLVKGGVKAVRVKYQTLRFGRRKVDQGVIEGPRYRISHAIGATAQQAAARLALENFRFAA